MASALSSPSDYTPMLAVALSEARLGLSEGGRPIGAAISARKANSSPPATTAASSRTTRLSTAKPTPSAVLDAIDPTATSSWSALLLLAGTVVASSASSASAPSSLANPATSPEVWTGYALLVSRSSTSTPRNVPTSSSPTSGKTPKSGTRTGANHQRLRAPNISRATSFPVAPVQVGCKSIGGAEH